MAGVLGVPMVSLLTAKRRARKQGMLGDSERRENVLDAFRAKNGYASRWRSVLVVDDVWTTGSTLREAARTLIAAGHEHVVAAVVARAMGERSG